MNIIVNGRHLEVTPALRDYAESKTKKFRKYLSTITEVIVTLSVEKYRHKAEVLLKTNGTLIQAESVTNEIYSAIDEVIEKLNRQIKKYKGKITSHRRESKASTAEISSLLPQELIPEIKIIKRKKFAMKPMTDEEAAMQMELLDKDFFVFSNAETGNINVVYKRKNGDFGLIEPA